MFEVKIKKKSESSLEVKDKDELAEGNISVDCKNNFFELLCDLCFFLNPFVHDNDADFKTKMDEHDLFYDKIQFFIDCLHNNMNEYHINLFTQLIVHPKFKITLFALLQSGETNIRVKCHDILDILTNYYS
jgi:hypothetical protein